MKQKQRNKVRGRAAKSVLRLPDLEVAKSEVLNSLSCPDAQRGYRHAIDEFVDWYCSEPRLSFSKTVVVRYRMHLESRQLAPGTINLRLGAVRRLAYEAADCGLLSGDLEAGIRRVKGVKKLGIRLGNWLTAEQAHALWQAPDREQVKGKRDRALLALLLACGLRRHELAKLSFGHLQQREGHWAIVDLRGKAGHVRTIPVPDWVYGLLNDWTTAAGINTGSLFRRVSSAGRVWGDAVTEKLVWHVVKEFAAKTGVSKLAPHDLRRSLRPPLSRRWRRTGADSGSAGPCLGADHGALPRLHPADFIGGQRPHRHRAETLSGQLRKSGRPTASNLQSTATAPDDKGAFSCDNHSQMRGPCALLIGLILAANVAAQPPACPD